LQHRDNGILPLKVHHLSGGYTATQPIEVEISLQFPAEARPLALHLLVRHASYLRVLTELVKTMGRLDREKATQLMDRVLSSDRFSHIFASRFGMSYRVVCLAIRMELSAHLVARTECRMSEIADLCGYSEHATTTSSLKLGVALGVGGEIGFDFNKFIELATIPCVKAP
jgi:AraC-like DNA-binding protein